MRKLICLVIAAAILPTPVFAQAKPKIETVRDAVKLLLALRGLSGKPLPQGGIVPFEFQNGKLLMRIAGDIDALVPLEHKADAARQACFKESLAKMPNDKDGKRPFGFSPGSAEGIEFQKCYDDALDEPSSVSEQLARIKASELKLDKNDVPVGALADLKPILDDDISEAK